MHAHNELTILNRVLMFTMNDVGDGELHNSAQSVQMWCNIMIAILTEPKAKLLGLPTPSGPSFSSLPTESAKHV
jgi:hypothetical protein